MRLPSSESDPYRKGVDIIIPSAPPNALVDPLALLRHHLRFNPGERNSPLFARAGSYPAAFQKGWSVDTLRRSITQPPALRPSILGIRSAGAFATWAKLSANLGDDDIRLLGRWSSNAVRLYQESTPAQLADISRATLTVNPSAPTGILPPAACWWGDE